MFKEHGQFWIGVDKNIIVVETKGKWNLEASTRCVQLLSQAIQSFQGKQFGLLFDTLSVEGFDPESYELWLQAVQSCISLGLIAFARRDDEDSPSYRVFLSNFDNVLKQKVAFKYVDSIEQGIEWIQQHNLKGFENGQKSVKGLRGRDD